MNNNDQFIQRQGSDVRKIKDMPVAGAQKRGDPE
jgi:hypothetical protein